MVESPFAAPPTKFTIAFAANDIEDLNNRLDKARWPLTDTVPDDRPGEGGDAPTAFGMGYGPKLSLMKELASEWRSKYSWDKAQKHLNKFNHFKVNIEDLDIHYVHHPSNHKDAIPICLIHGWPGSFIEFLDIIPYLTDPPTGTQAFHVVIPSLPGYTFSSPPLTSTWVMDDSARVFDKLMIGLGYHAYVAQGGDWGSVTARCLGALHSEHCKAVHLNFVPAFPPGLLGKIPARTLMSWLPSWMMSKQDRYSALRGLDYTERGSAYYQIQRFTPRTPAYALNDSPIGTLAWIAEKMLPAIDDAAKSPNPTLTKDTLFTTCTLYYLTSSIGTSFLPYAQQKHFSEFLKDPKYYIPNLAVSVFPEELYNGSKVWMDRTGKIGFYKEAEKGGHFAAAEEPKVLSEHLREAIAKIWIS